MHMYIISGPPVEVQGTASICGEFDFDGSINKMTRFEFGGCINLKMRIQFLCSIYGYLGSVTMPYKVITALCKNGDSSVPT